MKCFRKISILKLLLPIVYLITCFKGLSQTGGSSVYAFLDLTNSARVAALGGKNITLNDSDLNMPFHNPALLTPQMDQNIVLNYVSYFAQINYGYFSYALDKKNLGTFAIGIHYINYGEFDAASPNGVITGKFYAAEYALNLFYSRPINSYFRWGVNLKPIYSSLEHYNSYGLALDVGITYTTEDKLTSIAAVARNIGMQLYSYTGKYTEPLPFELLLGITRKLEYAPFRFSITAHNLQKYQLRYDLPDTDPTNFNNDLNQLTKFEKFTDNFFRHIIAGLEFVPSKSFYVSFAYNYQRRKEMALQDSPGTVGMSFGAGLRLKKFGFSYGYANYHAAGGSNHFSFFVNLSQFYHK
jgi:hypothetical protein